MIRRLVQLCLLAAAAAMAGCGAGGPGWARLATWDYSSEPPVIFEDVASYAMSAPGPLQPIRPIMLAGKAVVENDLGHTLRVVSMIALVEPADAPGRVSLMILVGDAPPDQKLVWRLYRSGDPESVEFWRYSGKTMIYGPAVPAPSARDASIGQWQFSACLDPGVSREGFDRYAAAMLELLEKMRADLRAEVGQSGGMSEREMSAPPGGPGAGGRARAVTSEGLTRRKR